MIISHCHKFIFIHVYRVGGTSISDMLYKYSTFPKESWSTIIKGKFGILQVTKDFHTHISASRLKEEIKPEIFNNYYKFAFTRNPWDWQVSLYHHSLQSKSHFQHDLISKMKSFEEYLDWRTKKDKHLQKEFVTDENGKLLVDFLGKFETLEDDFKEVSAKLGIKEILRHLNKSEHKDYRQYYNNQTKDLICQHFKEDIEMFGYSF